jgi:hypothetical protein
MTIPMARTAFTQRSSTPKRGTSRNRVRWPAAVDPLNRSHTAPLGQRGKRAVSAHRLRHYCLTNLVHQIQIGTRQSKVSNQISFAISEGNASRRLRSCGVKMRPGTLVLHAQTFHGRFSIPLSGHTVTSGGLDAFVACDLRHQNQIVATSQGNPPAQRLAYCCPLPQTIACSFIVVHQTRFRNKFPTVGLLG